MEEVKVLIRGGVLEVIFMSKDVVLSVTDHDDKASYDCVAIDIGKIRSYSRSYSPE